MRKVKVIIILFILLMTACNNEGADRTTESSEEQTIQVVTTFFPLYDLAREIGGTHVEVMNLIPAGVEPHDWQPGSRDMIRMTSADLFIYNGAGLEGWVESFIASLDERGPYVQAGTAGISLIGAEEHGHEADHDSGPHQEDHDHVHGPNDPHAWVSPLQAMKYASNIKDALIQIDPEHRQAYERNYNELLEQLEAIHEEYNTLAKQSSNKDFVVSHDAFAYLARDYGLRQHAIMGLSPDAEPTRQQISDISQFIRDHGVKTILFEEFVSPKLAQVLANDLNMDTMVIHSLEGLTKEQEARGETYLTLMRENRDILEQALR